ncbi:MAG TPA: hypothetical protein VGW33_14535 [Terriglobia bacterium]|nr:hypothetical protein [Terriglobia bacterium]
MAVIAHFAERGTILPALLLAVLLALPPAATGYAQPVPGQSEAAQAGVRVKARASALTGSGGQSAHSGKKSSETPRREPTGPAREVQRRLAQASRMEPSLAPVGLRDPFKPPPPPVVISEAELKSEAARLPGPRGLVISQLKLEGIVREEESRAMIAVVTNTTNLAYFLREHEPVYDGVVTRIALNAVYFQENIRDPDRGVTSREVVLRLGPAPGVAR